VVSGSRVTELAAQLLESGPANIIALYSSFHVSQARGYKIL